MKHIIQTQFVYKLDEDSSIEDGLLELIDEAEQWGYNYHHVLKTKEKEYIFTWSIMEVKEVNWNKEKAVEYLLR